MQLGEATVVGGGAGGAAADRRDLRHNGRGGERDGKGDPRGPQVWIGRRTKQ